MSREKIDFKFVHGRIDTIEEKLNTWTKEFYLDIQAMSAGISSIQNQLIILVKRERKEKP